MMRAQGKNDPISEVIVESHQDPLFCHRPFENLFVIGPSLASLRGTNDIMTHRFQLPAHLDSQHLVEVDSLRFSQWRS